MSLSRRARACGGLLVMARLPFHAAGILPLAFGTILARRMGAAIDPVVVLLSLAAVMLSIAATHYNGERYDIGEDRLCPRRTVFSSGTGLVIDGKLSGDLVRRAATVSAAAAILIGVALQAGLSTGPLTIVLGLSGVFSGYFYSKPPLRLVERGMGEPLIALCYGWLLPACGFYPHAKYLHPLLLVTAVPIACATVNLIWVNEILDLPNDSTAGKRNLVVRLGYARAVSVYRLVALVGAAGAVTSIMLIGGGAEGISLYLPALALSFIASAALNVHRRGERLLAACAATLAADLAAVAALCVCAL